MSLKDILFRYSLIFFFESDDWTWSRRIFFRLDTSWTMALHEPSKKLYISVLLISQAERTVSDSNHSTFAPSGLWSILHSLVERTAENSIFAYCCIFHSIFQGRLVIDLFPLDLCISFLCFWHSVTGKPKSIIASMVIHGTNRWDKEFNLALSNQHWSLLETSTTFFTSCLSLFV